MKNSKKIVYIVIALSSLLLGGCGNKTSTSEAVASSSSSVSFKPVVDFIYPPNKAHLGGESTVKIVLKVQDSSVSGKIDKITVGGNQLILEGAYWRSTNDLVVDTSNNQVFPVALEVDGALYPANSLVINNIGGSIVSEAGGTSVYSVRGVAVDKDSGMLFFSNPYDQQIFKYNATTGDSQELYSNANPIQSVKPVYWPIAVDSELNKLFVLTDTYGYDDVSGSEKYSIKLITVQNVDSSTPLISSFVDRSAEPVVDQYGETFPATNVIQSAKGIVLDLNAVMRSSSTIDIERIPSLYSLDFLNDAPVQRWFIGGNEAQMGRALSLSVGSSGVDGDITINKAPLAIAIQPDNKGLLIIRDGTSLAGGAPVLMAVNPTSQGQLGSKKLTYLDGVSKPTSLIFDHSGNFVYIADTDRLWSINLQTYEKELVSSSNNISGKVGSGPSLGSNITAMALHPTLNYLYLAADTNGVIMVDLETGNRITIIK